MKTLRQWSRLIITILISLCLGGGSALAAAHPKAAVYTADPVPPLELRICSSLPLDITQLLALDFAGKAPAAVSIAFLPAGSFTERLDFMRAGNFDLWLGGTTEEYYLASREEMLVPYQARESYKVPASMRNSEGYWTSLYLGYIGLISNKPNLAERGLYAPETWEELLAPELTGQIALPDYKNGGASYSMITSIWQLKGESAALSYAAHFNAQQPTLTATSAQAVDLVYTGAKSVAIIPLNYALTLENAHEHLYATIIKDANRNLISGAALLKGGRHGETARRFLDYLMSDASIQLLQEHGFLYLWHVKDYPHNVGRKELIGNVRVPVDDLSWTAVEKNDIIRAWEEARW